MAFKMKDWSGWSPLKQKKYQPPTVTHDTRYRTQASYNPESGTIRMGGGTYGVLSQKELDKMLRHETKHHQQVYERGLEGHRKKDDLDFEKWFKENTDFDITSKMSEDEFSNYRADMSEKWREEQYNVEGSNDSPGLMKKQ